MRSRLATALALFLVLISSSLESVEVGGSCTCGASRACAIRPRSVAKPACHKPAVAAAKVPPCHAALAPTSAPAPPSRAACELVSGCCQRHEKLRAAERPSEPPIEPLKLTGLPLAGASEEIPVPAPLERAVAPGRRPPRPFPIA